MAFHRRCRAFPSSRLGNVGSQRLLGCMASRNNVPPVLTSASKTHSCLVGSRRTGEKYSAAQAACWAGRRHPGHAEIICKWAHCKDPREERRPGDGTGTAGTEQLGKGRKRLREPSQAGLILLIKAASSQGLDNLSRCRLFTAVEFNTPMNKASPSPLERVAGQPVC